MGMMINLSRTQRPGFSLIKDLGIVNPLLQCGGSWARKAYHLRCYFCFQVKTEEMA
jgi:hypothetical protein